MRRRTVIAVLLVGFGALGSAHAPDALPSYVPERAVAGVISVWGNDQMQRVMSRWADGFRRYHPGARFEIKLLGTGTGMAGLYTSVADIALMGRSANSTEVLAFEWVFRYKPTGLQVTTGSVGIPGKSFAPVILVHKDNPLSSLTFQQLDAVLGSEHKRGPANIRTWGGLGLTGEWATRPIHVYAPDIQSATGIFLREEVLEDSYKWNCDLREFVERRRPDGSTEDALRQVAAALSKDRDGLGVGALAVAPPQLKPVALAREAGGASYLPSVDNVATRKYPLARATWVYVNVGDGHPLKPAVREFLRYILSQGGQDDVSHAGDYIPLSVGVAADQRRQLQ